MFSNNATFHLSPNFAGRDEAVAFVILHAMNLPTTQQALDILCDSAQEVSSHYLIDRAGELIQLVAEDQVAWHAGESAWGSQRQLNRNSIGIELMGLPNDVDGPYTEAQYQTLLPLLERIKADYNISPQHVLGHSDIAPNRKTDPGAGFEWFRLEQQGLAQRPPVTEHTLYAELADYGYQGDEKAVRHALMRRLGIKPTV